jgi:hypothetical protein
MTTKREKLTESLGDFNEWVMTGWNCDNRVGIWHSSWVNPTFTKEDLGEFPPIQTHCICSTKFFINYLIINKNTRSLAIVGIDCFQHFNKGFRPCFECFDKNYCRTKRCSNCRKKCKLHNEYHDDNTIHDAPIVRKKTGHGDCQGELIKEHEVEVYVPCDRDYCRRDMSCCYKTRYHYKCSKCEYYEIRK